ncbi:MAG TPA: hypothetical protein VMW08_18590 [Acidimicrobiales bacterium]|nr:hypothetical protein [Acidimicrobiales bacterium]
MIRKSCRVGLKLGLLAALVALIAKIIQSRPRPAVVPSPAEPGAAPSWPPVAPEAGKPAPATAEKPVSWVEPNGDVCPTTHPVKAKMSSKIFHVLGGLSYDRTSPDRCYATPADAEADGFRAAKR